MSTRRQEGILAALIASGLLLATGACVGEIVSPPFSEGEDPLAGIAGNSPASIEMTLTRQVIYKGRGIGENLLISAVNQALRENLLNVQITGEVAVPPPAKPASTCAFVDALGNGSSDQTNCRFLVERGRDLAYGRVGDALAENSIDEQLVATRDPDQLRTWYHKGTFSGVDGHVLRAVAELRTAGVCDTTPSPVTNSELAGEELGRALFTRVLAQQVSATARTQCDIDGGIIQPARTVTLAAVAAEIDANPLCPDGIGTTETDAILQLGEAKLAYEMGVRSGIDDEAVISAQRLLDTWVCELPVSNDGGGGGGDSGGSGDPLVVDLAGDGVAPLRLAEGVAFDLTGTGLARAVAWPAAGDPLLAIDLDGSGAIESGRELFGNYTEGPGGARFASGFAALAVYDHPLRGGNGDGLIDANDAVWGRLLLWGDTDRDGKSRSAELAAIATSRLSSLTLSATPARVSCGDAVITESAGPVHELWLDVQF